MNKYVVAYISFFDNEIKMSLQEAENEVEACKKFLKVLCNDDWINDIPSKLEELKDYLFNMDSAIEIIQI